MGEELSIGKFEIASTEIKNFLNKADITSNKLLGELDLTKDGRISEDDFVELIDLIENSDEIQSMIKNTNTSVHKTASAGFEADVSNFAEQFTNYSCAQMASVDGVFAGKDNRWCGVFTDYVLKNSGHYGEVSNWYKKLGNKWNPEAVYNAANKAGAVVSASEVRPGDLNVLNWENDDKYDHIGLVVSVNENSVTVMEGNNGNYTRKTKYAINSNTAFIRTT